MTISSVNSSQDITTMAVQSNSSSSLTETDFMLLLATELQYQDPTEPMDTDKLTEQTCMFAQLDELQNLGDQLADLEETLGNSGDPVSYLGQDVTVEGDTLVLTEGESSDVTVYLEGDADSVIIDIYDASGNIVSMQNWGSMPAGSHELDWDGTLLTGDTATDGTYTVKVRAQDENGQDIGAATTIKDTVVSVSNGTDGAVFTLKSGAVVNYMDIISVSLGEEKA
ncbi:flagellar hook assembly protein FlgD [Halodesulfovibrio marinisediminis]|uniref:Basal-body rod modification protein FlgD n=1 Tax=Halodesulfovibrio marinisediminis DSM 17456 TaxID=1121457 RepID=A0A1N6GTI9_9BACT|nr:FlgD immunoglobulin-like domain containing protein [Halodesulfovibrio marinisediminis]SIO10911.1 flagellar basal-body rod modification protein FlgD [Halodesulfovibrio marinisediminis DSM 17456]